jgi:DNA-binding MarR family transcriptional regulator
MNEESIGRLVSILYRMGLNYTTKQFEPYGIGGGRFAFLAELFVQDGISQEELASSIRCDKATVARAMQQLGSHGYVKRKRSLEDGRVNLVYLTEKAHNFRPELFSILSSWTGVVTQGLSIEERKLLTNLLSRLVENAKNNKLSNCELR